MRKSRLVVTFIFSLSAAWGVSAAAAQAVPDAAALTVFVVRHAERADTASSGQPSTGATSMMSSADPVLSPAGEARAKRLAAMLRDARITRIFTTEFARTRLTAAPLATAAGVTSVGVPAKDTRALLARLSERGGAALVVGHSNTVPEILTGLGIKEAIQIGNAEYDNLFVVVRHRDASHLVRLKYQ